MFIGVDHGTVAVRFGTDDGRTFGLSRETAKKMTDGRLLESILGGLNVEKSDIGLIAISYSMGDGITKITDIQRVTNRGVRCAKGAGTFIGGGTHIFDMIQKSGIPTIVLPGIHSRSDVDLRMKMFSHGASPEKVGAAYHAFLQGHTAFILSDISSNTVTLGVADGKIIGAIDACIFAPGILQGPLDLEAIRDVDSGKMSASNAFSSGGVLKHAPYKSIADLLSMEDGVSRLAIDRLALFGAMEIAAMKVLVEDYGELKSIFVCGEDIIRQKISSLLGKEILGLDRWCAAIGCAEIARDVYAGKDDILGIKVDHERK